nr:MAG TPA: hypothetical protein [Caudoviricetes sp.]
MYQNCCSYLVEMRGIEPIRKSLKKPIKSSIYFIRVIFCVI